MFGIKTKIKKYLKKRYGLFDDLTNVRISPIGYPCNHACTMCWRAQLTSSERNSFARDEVKHLTLQEYTQMFASLPKSVKYMDIVGGGEPLLYSDIISVCKLLKRKNVHGRLITNGALLNEVKIKELVNCSWDEIRISFHAGSANVYKKIHGIDDFNKVIANIQLLLSMRGKRRFPKISLLYVIQKNNENDIISFVKLTETLKVDSVEFDSLLPINPITFLKPRQSKGVVASLKEAQKIIHIEHNIPHALHMYAQHPLWDKTNRTADYFKDKYCDTVQVNVDISCGGDVVPCCLAYGTIKYGNVRDKPLPELWKQFRSFRREMAEGKFQPFCYKLCNYELAKR